MQLALAPMGPGSPQHARGSAFQCLDSSRQLEDGGGFCRPWPAVDARVSVSLSLLIIGSAQPRQADPSPLLLHLRPPPAEAHQARAATPSFPILPFFLSFFFFPLLQGPPPCRHDIKKKKKGGSVSSSVARTRDLGINSPTL